MSQPADTGETCDRCDRVIRREAGKRGVSLFRSVIISNTCFSLVGVLGILTPLLRVANFATLTDGKTAYTYAIGVTASGEFTRMDSVGKMMGAAEMITSEPLTRFEQWLMEEAESVQRRVRGRNRLVSRDVRAFTKLAKKTIPIWAPGWIAVNRIQSAFLRAVNITLRIEGDGAVNLWIKMRSHPDVSDKNSAWLIPPRSSTGKPHRSYRLVDTIYGLKPIVDANAPHPRDRVPLSSVPQVMAIYSAVACGDDDSLVALIEHGIIEPFEWKSEQEMLQGWR